MAHDRASSALPICSPSRGSMTTPQPWDARAGVTGPNHLQRDPWVIARSRGLVPRFPFASRALAFYNGWQGRRTT